MTSIFKMLEPLRKAEKSSTGQFINIPDWLFERDRNADVKGSEREQAKRVFSKPGKINPADMDKLVANKNLDILHLMATTRDLTSEETHKILYSPGVFPNTVNYFAPGADDATIATHYGSDATPHVKETGFATVGKTLEQKKKVELFTKLGQDILREGGDSANEFLKNGPEDAVATFVKNGQGGPVNLFHLITERPQLSGTLVSELMHRSTTDASHLTELLNRKEPHVRRVAVMRANTQHFSPENISKVLNSGDTDLLKEIFNNNNAPLSKNNMMFGLKHADPEVQSKAIYRVAKNPSDDAVNHIIDQMPARAVNQFLADNRYGTKDLSPEHAEKITKRIENEPEAAHSSVFGMRSSGSDFAFSDDQKNRIMRAAAIGQPSQNQNDILSEGVKNTGSLHPETVNTILNSGNEPHQSVLDHLSQRKDITPDHVRQIYNIIKEKSKSEDGDMPWQRPYTNMLGKIIGNANIPDDVINDMALMPDEQMPESFRNNLITSGNAPTHIWEKYAFGDELVHRMLAAFSPKASPEQTLRGLQDPNKEVRAAWIKHGKNFDNRHWDAIKKDRVVQNRISGTERSDVPTDVMMHFLGDKDEGVRSQALKSPGLSDDNVSGLIDRLSPKEILDAGYDYHAPKALNELSLENSKKLYAKMKKEHAEKSKSAKELAKKPEFKGAKESQDIEHSNMLFNFFQSGKNTKTLLSDAIKTAPAHFLNVVHKIDDDALTPEHYRMMAERKDVPRNVKQRILEKQNLPKEFWDKELSKLNIKSLGPADKFDFESDAELSKKPLNWHEIIKNNSMPTEWKNKFIQEGHPDFAFTAARNSNDPDVLRLAHQKANSLIGERDEENPNLIEQKDRIHDALLGNNATPSDVISKMYDDPYAPDDFKDNSYLYSHPNAPAYIIKKGLKHAHQGIREIAMKKIALHQPDAANEALGGHDIHIHPDTEKLKHLKGIIQDAGGILNKNKLTNKGQGLPVELLDAKGNISEQSIDQYIDKLPKDRYNVTYGEWNGAQRHDRSKKQMVVQLNLTDSMAKELKDKGLWDTFRFIHNATQRSGHPVQEHSIGWSRIDHSHPDHYHIDEIQSDLGQGTIREIEKYKESGDMTPEDADKKSSDLKQIIKILSGKHKDINHAISSAVHEVGRKNDIKTTSYDMLNDQAEQSGMETEAKVNPLDVHKWYESDKTDPDVTGEYKHKAITAWAKKHGVENDREAGAKLITSQIDEASKKPSQEFWESSQIKLPVPLPGHMISNYKDTPEKLGYKPADKKSVMPNSNSNESQVQLRKLVKSLTKLFELYKIWSRGSSK
jgi:hypothetical protein